MDKKYYNLNQLKKNVSPDFLALIHDHYDATNVVYQRNTYFFLQNNHTKKGGMGYPKLPFISYLWNFLKNISLRSIIINSGCPRTKHQKV